MSNCWNSEKTNDNRFPAAETAVIPVYKISYRIFDNDPSSGRQSRQPSTRESKCRRVSRYVFRGDASKIRPDIPRYLVVYRKTVEGHHYLLHTNIHCFCFFPGVDTLGLSLWSIFTPFGLHELSGERGDIAIQWGLDYHVLSADPSLHN